MNHFPAYTGHTVDCCWAKGGGAEGKGLKMRPSKGNLKGKGKKAGSPKVAKGRQRLPRTTNHHLPHQWCISLMLKLSCLRTHQILGRLTSISTLRPQIIYVTPETIFPHTGNSNPLGELKLQMDIAMPSVLATSLSIVNGIKWVLHPDTICNEAQPGRH